MATCLCNELKKEKKRKGVRCKKENLRENKRERRRI